MKRATTGVRDLTEWLAAPLSDEDQCAQSMPDASPTKWHRAHTTWFFETFVLRDLLQQEPTAPAAWSVLFNSYYQGVGERWSRPHRGLLTRPSNAQIRDWRQRVDGALLSALDRIEQLPPETAAALQERILLGLHHEQQHQELLLTDVKHLLARNVLDCAWKSGALPQAAPAAQGWEEHPGGVVQVGEEAGFLFDNEGPPHRVLLEPFALRSTLVTNSEVRAFMDDGGYQRFELWMDAGWAWVQQHGIRAPLYWREDGQQFTLKGRQPIDPKAPACHLSWFEADAIARWAGCRLPTEAEWEALAPKPDAVALGTPHGHDWHPHPTAHSWYGAVWQWTRSEYAPYPRYRAAPGAIGEYNGKFMVGQYVLRGGSCATSPGHVRPSYRNFFPPTARWQFTGLRLAQDRT